MITKNSTEPQTSSSSGATGSKPAVMNPRGTIEVASDGNGVVNDPSGKDIKPPFTGGFEVPV